MNYKYEYNGEDDVLSIYNSNHKPSESVEFSEFINIDLNNEGYVVGLEIFNASEFFSILNKEIDKSFLLNLKSAALEQVNYRNILILAVVLKTETKVISQQLPPLPRSEYRSPLLAH